MPRDTAGMAVRSRPPYGLPDVTAKEQPNQVLALVGADDGVDDSWTRL